MGRIHEDDIAEVRSRARIEEVIGSYVQLQRAGGDSLKGLCPFHTEKTPSFQVTPSRGFFYCFGCGEGGDVISFVQKVENFSFQEAVEQLADRVGIQLRIIDDDGGPRLEPGTKLRILAANTEAAEFYAKALFAAEEALPGRQMLDSRGFDKESVERFGCGWAPKSGRELVRYLIGKGFSEPELIKAGLVRNGGWDYFQGRVLWPIRDAGKQVLGFGARRIFDDDRMPAKYLNTSETPVYKKSHVLYGLDLARSNIGKREQAVVVEGYTDVMACHLAGVDTAIASCGTAFGADHAALLQRLLGSGKGEVIFTFDGDAAGQAAALKVYAFDANFTSQTYVAIEPTGLDPCDLRMKHGDAAVRELVGRRIALYRFVMRNVLTKHDLDRADGRLAALREAAPLVSGIRDQSLVLGFARELAGDLGMPESEVIAEVRQGSSQRKTQRGSIDVAAYSVTPSGSDQPGLIAFQQPDPADRVLEIERSTAKLIVQAPQFFTADWNLITANDFAHPGYQAVFRAATNAGDFNQYPNWAQKLTEVADSDAAGQLIITLSVEPLLREPSLEYTTQHSAKLRLRRTDHDISTLKSKVQRTNPVDHPTEYNKLFLELVNLEAKRKQLQQLVFGN